MSVVQCELWGAEQGQVTCRQRTWFEDMTRVPTGWNEATKCIATETRFRRVRQQNCERRLSASSRVCPSARNTAAPNVTTSVKFHIWYFYYNLSSTAPNLIKTGQIGEPALWLRTLVLVGLYARNPRHRVFSVRSDTEQTVRRRVHKISKSFVMSVRPNGTTRLSLDGFSWDLIWVFFENLSRKFEFN